jgi:hypothetical protein
MYFILEEYACFTHGNEMMKYILRCAAIFLDVTGINKEMINVRHTLEARPYRKDIYSITSTPTCSVKWYRLILIGN